jgi:hypothetical protein
MCLERAAPAVQPTWEDLVPASNQAAMNNPSQAKWQFDVAATRSLAAFIKAASKA